MGAFQAIILILKYFPIVIDLVKKLDERAENAILDYRIDKANKKIDEVFRAKGDNQERAKELNSVFTGKDVIKGKK